MARSVTDRARLVAPVALLALVATACGTSGAAGTPASARRRAPSTPRPVRAWPLAAPLAAPLSREVVVPGPGRDLVVLGGLTAADSSASGVYLLDTHDARLSYVGALASPLHDAGGVVLAGRDLLFGGGATVSVATVEAFPAPKLSSRGLAGTVVGSLPSPRSDTVAVSIGSTVYVVGGYDGVNPAAAVLATTDGRHFRTVATLPVPVRYPALAAFGGELYVFGGEAIGGSASGTAVRTVQVVNPVRRRATVLGRLPTPLAGAAAAVLGGTIYVAGGDTVATPAGGGSATAGAILAFTPATKRFRVAGHLAEAVSHAGLAVQGGRAYLVGGEHDGVTVGTIQAFALR